MKFTKTLIAVAMLASTGVANASLAFQNSNGTDEAWLSVYDPKWVNPADATTPGRTFNFDLGVTMAQVEANGLSAFSAYANGVNLATNSNSSASWATFASGMSTSGLSYYIMAADQLGGNGGFVLQTGSAALPANGQTNLVAVATNIDAHAGQVATGEINLNAGANSAVIPTSPITVQYGQFNIPSSAVGLYGAAQTTYDPTAAYGSSINLYFDTTNSYSVVSRGKTVTGYEYLPSDAQLLGQVTLNGSTLTINSGVSAVPLPTAVWMFGAGLMGLLGLNRRKAVKA